MKRRQLCWDSGKSTTSRRKGKNKDFGKETAWHAPEDAKRPVWLKPRDPGGETRKMRTREAGRGQTMPGPTGHSTDFKSYSMCDGNAN